MNGGLTETTPLRRSAEWTRPANWTMVRGDMKRSVALVAAFAGLVASARLGLRHADDAWNVSRLRKRYGIGERDARRLYRLSRSEGFGYAARRMLQDRPPAAPEDEPPAD